MGLFSRSGPRQVHAAPTRSVDEALAALDPPARLKRPEWRQALEAADVDPDAVVFAAGGDSGSIEVHERRVLIDRGVLLVTRTHVAYAYCDGERVIVETRPMEALLDLRHSNEKHHFYVVFRGDTVFHRRPGAPAEPNFWRIHSPARADDPSAADHAAVLAGFRAAGVPC